MSKVSFIGLGVMGYPMAGHLRNSGHEVTVFNRTSQKAETWQMEYGGRVAGSPAEASLGADFVCICVGNDDDLRGVTLAEEGVLSTLGTGASLIDHTTASAGVARELGEVCAAKGIGFVDAPVSGGQAGAENGQLTIMCGASDGEYEKVEPVISAYAKHTQRMGEVGSGQLTKMVNQICLGGLLQSLSEALLFAEKSGLDVDAVINTISQGAAGSWQMQNRYRTMIDGEFEHGFAVDWYRKDLGIVFEEAKRMELAMPLTEQIDGYYKEIQQMGGGRWDTSALMKRLRASLD